MRRKSGITPTKFGFIKKTWVVLAVMLCQAGTLRADSSAAAINQKPAEELTVPPKQAEAKEQRLPLYNLLTAHEVNQKHLTFGTYHLVGYVTKKYTCPPCPAGSQCKPCMPEYIVISEENKPTDVNNLSDNDLIIFVDNAGIFEVGKKYRCLIHILDLKTTPQVGNDVKLIYFEKVEESPAL